MSHPKQSDITFEEINLLVWNHLVARDWHELDPRSLAISIALEANELLEHYQWSRKSVGSKDELAAELADVLIYCFEFAQRTDIDMADAVKKKLAKAAEKYPAEAFKGQDDSGQRTAWLTAKNRYNKKETL
jgi:dCTP diphosphatase